MDQRESIAQDLSELANNSPAGFAIALHIDFTTPKFLFQTYAKTWMDEYSSRGFVMRDPTVHWGFANTGHIRWSDLTDLDTDGVLALADEYGLRYGVTLANAASGSRTVASFSRADREYLDAEIADIQTLLGRLHNATHEITELSAQTQDTLRQMSIRLTHS